MESWLGEGRDAPPPKPVTRIALAGTRPHLDGVLGEPCWQGEAVHVGEARAWLARDNDYLYLAVSCPKVSGVDYPRDARPRPHDGDIEPFDHVRLRLDLDRDYATCFELVVDSRGWTADRAWGDASWNPEWFVAAGETSDAGEAMRAWTAEAAISLAELAEHPPQAGDAWGCRIERRIPSHGPEQWPATEKASGPQGYGVLLFN
jgi:hypothetical protein